MNTAVSFRSLRVSIDGVCCVRVASGLSGFFGLCCGVSKKGHF